MIATQITNHNFFVADEKNAEIPATAIRMNSNPPAHRAHGSHIADNAFQEMKT